MTYFGFSGYGVSVADLQNLVPIMQGYHMNTIRISGTPPWLAQGAHALKYEYVDYILANTDFNVIVDPNHLFGSTPGYTSADFKTNLAMARAKLLEIAQRYKDNPRVFIEIVNEFYDPTDSYPSGTKTYALIQGLINDVRAVCSNPTVWDKQPPPVPYQPLTGDPVFQGDHAYFGPNQYSAPSIFNAMKAAAASYGLRFICTEVGADWNEGPNFTATSVGTLNGFLSDCNDNNFGVCIWLRELTGEATNPDLIAYRKFGLKIPTNIIPPPPSILYVLDVWTVLGGTTTPTGLTNYPSGTEVQVTARAAEGYVFAGWLANNQARTENPLTLTMTENLTVMPIFNLGPTPPPPSQNNIIAAAAVLTVISVGFLYTVTRKG